MKKIICQIPGCKTEVKSLNGLAQHIRFHKDVTLKDYYLIYINPNEVLKCPYCDLDRKFEGLYGFKTTCGNPICVKKSHDEKMAETCKQKRVDNGTYLELKYQCPFCTEKFPYAHSIHGHVGKKHKDITPEQLYLKVVNPNADPKCPHCFRIRLFANSVQGYRKTCGNEPCVTLEKEVYFKSHKQVHPFIRPETIATVQKNNLKTYGRIDPQNSEKARKKALQTTIKAKGSSKIENQIWEHVLSSHEDAKRNYMDTNRYKNYSTDIYIPSLNLFIEVQGSPMHGFCAFDATNKDCQSQLNEWSIKAETIKYYRNMIKGWTIRDPEKRILSIKHGFKLLEIFDYSSMGFVQKQIDRILGGLNSSYPIETQKEEYIRTTLDNEGGYEKTPNTNKIILSHQPTFYRKENELWQNPIIRRKLIQNRMKYLDSEECELTDRELLRGFKISGIYRGFSHFSPFWIKQFIRDYSVKSIYDPCGGWGHRLIGTSDMPYIYNDLNTDTLNGAKSICEFLNLKNKTLYNNDATQFTPAEDYEATFTCPPYFNVEDYGQTYKTYEDWLCFVKGIFSKAIKPSVKYIGIVVTSKFSNDLKPIINNLGFVLDKEVALGRKYGSHFGKSKHGEVLLTFVRPLDKPNEK